MVRLPNFAVLSVYYKMWQPTWLLSPGPVFRSLQLGLVILIECTYATYHIPLFQRELCIGLHTCPYTVTSSEPQYWFAEMIVRYLADSLYVQKLTRPEAEDEPSFYTYIRMEFQLPNKSLDYTSEVMTEFKDSEILATSWSGAFIIHIGISVAPLLVPEKIMDKVSSYASDCPFCWPCKNSVAISILDKLLVARVDRVGVP